MFKSGLKSKSIAWCILAGILSGSSSAVLAKDYVASYFNIQAGGSVLNTRSIQFGVDYISQSGGGRLVFPPGVYLTGSIHFKSNVIIQLDEGAVLRGSANPMDYDRQNTGFDHNFNTSVSLVLGLKQNNIGITGEGLIDGQGTELAANVGAMLKKGFVKGGTADRPDEDQRPMIINLFGCENVLVKNVTLKNSACWTECYNQCRNVFVDSIHVDSRSFWNNDGIDIVDCQNFKITNSSFNASDDGICLKSLDPNAADQDILIQNNSISTDASGIKFGTASLGAFKKVRILNNRIFDTNRSAVALEAVDGATIEDVEVDGIEGVNIGNAIFLRAGARKGTRKGTVKNVVIRNVRVGIRPEKEPLKAMPGIVIAGMPDQVISDIVFNNITLTLPGGAERVSAKVAIENLNDIPERPASYPEYTMFGELPSWGVYMRHAQDVSFTGLSVSAGKADFRTAIVLDDVHKCSFNGLTVKEPVTKNRVFTSRSSAVSEDKPNAGLVTPSGFTAVKLIEGIGKVRHIVVTKNGDIYARLARPVNGKGTLLLEQSGGKATVKMGFGNYGGTGVHLYNGWLYTASNSEIFRYKVDKNELVTDTGARETVVTGLLDKGTHETKSIMMDNAGNMYIPIGCPLNSCQEVDRMKGSMGIPGCPLLAVSGGVWQFRADRLHQTYADGARYATGLRNVVAVDWNTETNQLYVMQHGRDQLDNIFPALFNAKQNAEIPAECMYALKKGDNAGWPYIYYDLQQQKKIQMPEYGGDGKKEGSAEYVDPAAAYPAHMAPDDILFYTGNQFPAKYKNGAFIAFHGSWNRAPEPQAGYYVVFQPFKNGKPSGAWEVFADGFSGSPEQTASGRAEHRPCGLAQGPDGSLYVTDDVKGAIYKISYPNVKVGSATPCMDVLHLFTEAGVPAMAPEEELAPLIPSAEPTPANLPGNSLSQHPMLYVGENCNRMSLVKDGKVIWTYNTGKGPEYDDVWMLSNGNILFTRMQYVALMTPDKKILWRYDCNNSKGPEHTEVHTCQPIGLDKVMFVVNGLPPKLFVVNIRTGKVEVEHELPYKQPANPGDIHPQFRRVRVTAQGTYLVSFLNMGRVVEYDSSFKEIWSYRTRQPWAALRLKNGNTLITDEVDARTTEVNAKGETVWQFDCRTDLPTEYQFTSAPQTCTRLENGNTIFTSRGEKGRGPQLIEVTRDKRVVWVLHDWQTVGDGTAVQILDDPGVPEVPGQSEH